MAVYDLCNLGPRNNVGRQWKSKQLEVLLLSLRIFSIKQYQSSFSLSFWLAACIVLHIYYPLKLLCNCQQWGINLVKITKKLRTKQAQYVKRNAWGDAKQAGNVFFPITHQNKSNRFVSIMLKIRSVCIQWSWEHLWKKKTNGNSRSIVLKTSRQV